MSDKKYCRLCKKKETRNQCGYGPRLFDKYSVDDATEKETAEAASEAGITEENKSGDSSLHDWFNKSKSSDGKKGWVQLGGKYAGKPCAKQPGQTTKPKCGSSKMKRNLDKGEEQAAFRRKQKEDPNPNRKGKAINVKTEETLHEADYWHPDPKKDRQYGGEAKARHREDRGSQSSPSSSAKKKDDSKKLRPGESYMDYAKRQKGGSLSTKPKKKSLLGKLGLRKEESEQVDEKCWAGYEKKGMKTMFGKRYPNCVKKTKKEEVETQVQEEGKKDACYHKVKSRYSVWPSAYASGALVKCRKKGAKNWGNKTKKEELELTDAYGDTFATITNLIEPEPIQVVTSAVEYDTYELEEATRVNAVTGNLIHVILSWKGRTYGMKMFFPQVKMPKRSEVQAELEKVYPECRVMYFKIVEKQPGETFLHVSEGAAWTKKSGKNSEGGLNEKGRKSYERENPGSDLKAPSKKVGNPRRASFCARMKGMKKKLTSSKTANDPDSRINKSLRAWNC
jgi:hypothetical protein